MKSTLSIAIFVLLTILFTGCFRFTNNPNQSRANSIVLSDEEFNRIENIFNDIEIETAIIKALETFPQSSFPVNNYIETQELRINRILNEYGMEYNRFNTYREFEPNIREKLNVLNSRLSTLYDIRYKNSRELQNMLILLKE